jgi:hypothetical protein
LSTKILLVPLLLLLIWCSYPRPASSQDFLQDQQVIGYRQGPSRDPVARLQQRLDRGEAKLDYDESNGYLTAVLRELQIPVSSQGLVFSKTSFQLHRIEPLSPRAIYFNDDAYVGWVRGGDVLELGAVDPERGGIFYVLEQTKTGRPKLIRNDECLQCHAANNTRNVPGFVVRSVYPDDRGYPISSLGSHVTDHTSPLNERWGGWYVTGTHGSERHAGNLLFEETSRPELPESLSGGNLTSLVGRFSPRGYLSPHSDIVALLVLEHQTQTHNLVTRLSYETRIAKHHQQVLDEALHRKTEGLSDSARRRIERATAELVRQLLFIGEARWRSPITGTSSFAREFTAGGRRDRLGRSLRDLDLQTRLFRYPCSYLIYSDSITALPTEARQELWRQLQEALSGKSPDESYKSIPLADRQAVIEILQETKFSLN